MLFLQLGGQISSPEVSKHCVMSNKRQLNTFSDLSIDSRNQKCERQRLFTFWHMVAALFLCAWIEPLLTGRANRALGVQVAAGAPPSSGAALGVGAGRGQQFERHTLPRAGPIPRERGSLRERMRAHTKCSAKVGDRLAACSRRCILQTAAPRRHRRASNSHARSHFF